MYNQAALATGNKPSAVVVADFNGDGKLDLAVTNENDNTVSVLLTKPDGSFAPKVDYPVGNTPLQLVSADFNGDGKIDLAVVNSKDNTISILLGVGDGTFGKQVTYPTGTLPVAITAADFNGDKHIDLAIANQTDGTVSVLFGNGDGSFISQTSAVVAGATPFSITSADMNGDAKPDLLLLSGTISKNATLYLLTNKGNGTFNSGSSLLTDAMGGMAVGDINHDGNQDIAVTLSTSNSVSILLGNGTGSFQTHSLDVTSSLGAPPQTIVMGDFNQDGNLDLVVEDLQGSPMLLRNPGLPGRHWASFELAGTKSNRLAIGARLKIVSGGMTQTEEIHSGGSYLSQNDLHVHFGLGTAAKIESVEIRWPSGAVETLKNLEADKFYSVLEGQGIVPAEKIRPTMPPKQP